MPGSESVQRFLHEALRVIRAATDVSGDVQKALYWYRNEHLPVFDYKTAEQLVSEERSEDVLPLHRFTRSGRSWMILTALHRITAYRMHVPLTECTYPNGRCRQRAERVRTGTAAARIESG